MLVIIENFNKNKKKRQSTIAVWFFKTKRKGHEEKSGNSQLRF
jgi:hypothetical protein